MNIRKYRPVLYVAWGFLAGVYYAARKIISVNPSIPVLACNNCNRIHSVTEACNLVVPSTHSELTEFILIRR